MNMHYVRATYERVCVRACVYLWIMRHQRERCRSQQRLQFQLILLSNEAPHGQMGMRSTVTITV